MEKVTWNKIFSVGVKEIDEQHKELINIINKLIEAEKRQVDSEIVSEILADMGKYADYHFKAEERYMSEYSYPEYEQHKVQHAAFIAQATSFHEDTVKNKERISAEILSYLVDWLLNHILKSDMKFKTFFKGKGVE